MKYVLNNLRTELNKIDKKNVIRKSIMKQINENFNTIYQ
jgi:hypothetical protein